MDVGGAEGEVGAGQGGGEEGEAVVELVVADGGGVVIERVHGADGGVDVAGGHVAGQRHVVSQRVALDGVAVVEQQGVLRLGAGGADEGGGLGEADGVVRRVAEIVVVFVKTVEVGGFQQAEFDDGAGGGAGGRGEGCEGGGGLEEGAAGEGVGHAGSEARKWRGAQPWRVVEENSGQGFGYDVYGR